MIFQIELIKYQNDSMASSDVELFDFDPGISLSSWSQFVTYPIKKTIFKFSNKNTNAIL